MITLSNAYEAWSRDKSYASLPIKYRTAMTEVFLKSHGEETIDTFSEERAREILSSSTASRENLTKAVSALVTLLKWCAESGQCEKPSFDLGILSWKEPTTDALKMLTDMVEEPKDNAQARPVVEVNPKTHEVIARFVSVSECQRKTGFTNLHRNIHACTPRSGRYFAYEDQLDTWKPSQDGRSASRRAKPAKPSAVSLADFSDEELRDELRRRGWTGEVTQLKRLTF